MTVPDEIRKCVAFVAMRMADKSFRFVGSGFFFGRGPEGQQAQPVRFVTARHVIEKIKHKAVSEVYLRLNRVAGDATWFQTDVNDWFYHPADNSIDVAMLPFGVPEGFDHLIIPFSLGATANSFR